MNHTKKIAIIGDIIADEYLTGDSERMSPEYPTPVINNIKTEIRCGGASNVAVCLSEFSSDFDLYFSKASDYYGNIILKKLKKTNAYLNYNTHKSISTTTKKRIYVGKNQIARIDKDFYLKKNFSDFIIKKLISNIKKYNILIISDYGKGQISPSIQNVILYAKQMKTKVIVDPYGTSWDKYKNSYCLTPNKKELEGIVGKIKNKEDLIKKSFNIIHKLKLKFLLVTLGSEGMCLLSYKKKFYFLDGIVKQVFDVTGAGDTVCAVFGYFLSKGFNEKKSMQFANQFASLAVTKFGVSPISIEEYLHSFISSKNIIKVINSSKALDELILFYKALNLKIVFTNGCFDIIHSGHVEYLEKSKKLGDIIILGLNSDQSIKKLKGNSRPYNKIDHRIKVLSSFNFIDHIIVFNELTPLNLIKKIRPNLLTKGDGYLKKKVIGYDFIKSYGGDIKIIKSGNNKSTSKLIDLIK